MAVGNLPAFAVASFNMRWVFSNIGCQIYGFVGSIASLTSITTLTLIAIERSIVIVHQLPWYQKTSVIWHEREIDQIALKTNSKIYFTNVSRERRKQKREFKTAKIAFGIILVFCFSWLPYAVVAMIGCFNGKLSLITPMAVSVSGLCAKIATAVNPILYALIHPKYRGKVRKDMKKGVSFVFKTVNNQDSRISHSNDSNEELQFSKFNRKESITNRPKEHTLLQKTDDFL
ncbi:rhodopsin-like [Mizuhopecten yessoensis]|uniref:rhodopsin-like n=1 Tax=Mizuhopecten yessoensis TaxID=6573 RepID=UPI000B45E729|nr:rhodopsin-like [Mizuhopecten yessoensis]